MNDDADALRDILARYDDPNRPGPCGECGRRPVPSHFVPDGWVDSHSGTCSQNSALQACERCGHRHVDRDFGQVLSCVMDVPLEEGRAMQERIVNRLTRDSGTPPAKEEA